MASAVTYLHCIWRLKYQASGWIGSPMCSTNLGMVSSDIRPFWRYLDIVQRFTGLYIDKTAFSDLCPQQLRDSQNDIWRSRSRFLDPPICTHVVWQPLRSICVPCSIFKVVAVSESSVTRCVAMIIHVRSRYSGVTCPPQR
jgi:hypothetical protein